SARGANLRGDDVRALLAPGAEAAGNLRTIGGGDVYTTAEKWHRLATAVQQALTAFQPKQPRQPGMEMESLRSYLAPDLPPKAFRAVVEQLAAEQVLVRTESLVRLPSHSAGLDRGETRAAEQIVARLRAAGFTPPDVKHIAADLGLAGAQLNAILGELERGGRIVRAAPDLCFAADAVERARDLI